MMLIRFQVCPRIEEVRFTSSKSNKVNTTDKKDLSSIYVSFIDILFAVVLGQSFVLLNSEEGFKPWLVQPRENAFGIATLLLVYGLVITSWIGYHQSTRKYPIKSPLRFVIDVLLLFLYYVGFVNANNFEIVSWIFFFTFLSYTLWDVFRIVEYRTEMTSELWKRLGISVGFAIMFLIISLAHVPMETQIQGIEWGLFVAILVLLVLYRYLKWYKK